MASPSPSERSPAPRDVPPSSRLGEEAFAFVDWPAAAGQSFWQVLPLGPPDAGASDEERGYALQDLARAGIDGDDLPWALVRLALASPARVGIVPAQDLLALGAEARMNSPGTLGAHNWSWRLREGQLMDELARRLRAASAESGRLHSSAARRGSYDSAAEAAPSLRSVRSTSRVS